MTKADATKIDWNNLGFNYMDLPYRFTAYWKDGAWQNAGLTEDSTLHISEASPVLHYGQAAFEGMKAYRTPEGKIQLFRPDRNAKRLKDSCERLLMPVFPEDKFVEAVKSVVKANADFVPPYGNGATLYIRPLIIGTGEQIGVHAAPEYIFTILATTSKAVLHQLISLLHNTTVLLIKVLVKVKLVVTTLPVSIPAKKHMIMVSPTVFT